MNWGGLTTDMDPIHNRSGFVHPNDIVNNGRYEDSSSIAEIPSSTSSLLVSFTNLISSKWFRLILSVCLLLVLISSLVIFLGADCNLIGLIFIFYLSILLMMI